MSTIDLTAHIRSAPRPAKASCAPANTYRESAIRATRAHAQWIKAQPSVTVEDKIAVGFVSQPGGRR